MLGKFCMTTWLANGYEVEFFAYDTLLFESVPEGITCTDAREVLPELEIFPEPKGRTGYSGFSNLFRIELMKKRNGVWVDLDIVAISPLKSVPPYIFAKESRRWINGAVFRSPAESELTKYLEDVIRTKASEGYWEFGELGPRAITVGVAKFKLRQFEFNREAFYAISGIESWKLYSAGEGHEVRLSLSNSYFIHIANEISKQLPFPALGLAPQNNSYLWSLNPDFWAALNATSISDEQMAVWKKQANKMQLRSRIANFLPASITRLYLRWRLHKL